SGTAFAPCYGLAEATVFVTGIREPGPARIVHLLPDPLRQGYAVQAEPGTRTPALVRCGAPASGVTVPGGGPDRGARRGPGEVGEIWVDAPSVSAGYWGRPAQTADTFGARLPGDEAGRFLRTGDLGVVLDGQLFVVGRLKDLIIIDGRNHHPQDI